MSGLSISSLSYVAIDGLSCNIITELKWFLIYVYFIFYSFKAYSTSHRNKNPQISFCSLFPKDQYLTTRCLWCWLAISVFAMLGNCTWTSTETSIWNVMFCPIQRQTFYSTPVKLKKTNDYNDLVMSQNHKMALCSGCYIVAMKVFLIHISSHMTLWHWKALPRGCFKIMFLDTHFQTDEILKC